MTKWLHFLSLVSALKGVAVYEPRQADLKHLLQRRVQLPYTG